MPAFHYVAITAQGQEKKGVIEAENEKQARQLLRNKTYLPLHLRPAQEKKTTTHSFSNFLSPRNLSGRDLALITRQFATLLSAGLPIEEALLAVSEQSEKPHVKGLILSVRSKVVEGHALASALREHPQSFSSLFCATIAAGEKSGHLEKVLTRLADYTEQQSQMRQKLKTALIYPSMIIFIAIGIVGFLLAYVVPKMVAVYSNLHESLPTMTQVLLVISDVVTHYGLAGIGLLALSIFFLRRLLKKNASMREKAHHLALRLPLIGKALKTSNTARFSRTLSILSASGVPVLEAMTISVQLISIMPMRQAIEVAVQRVKEGTAIHLALKQANYFSPMAVHMIASGEASGQLENMLERVAITQEDDITRLIEVALALFEPAIILIMGAIVLFIVLAVLLPIFQLNQLT